MRSQLTTQGELNASNVPIVTQIDSYDAVGNRMTRSVNGTVATWSYDDLYRLTGQVKPGQVATYTLDGVGNLKTMWDGGAFPRTFTFNAADRLVTMVEGANLTTYTWTGYGALSSETTGTATTDYSYNGQDQLVLVTPPGDGFPTTYTFDGDGLRRSIQATNVNQDSPTLDITTVVWDGSDYLLLNGPNSDTVVLTLGGEIVSSGSFDLLPDSLGSVIGDIRSGQDPRVPFSYWPYGTMLLSMVQPSFPFLYVGSLGYYYDSTDRDYVRARELMKATGRWMQVDPLWPYSDGFGYCRQNPIQWRDSLGLQVFGFDPSDLLPIQPPSLDHWLNLFSCGCENRVAPCRDVSSAFGHSLKHDMTNALGHCMTACCIKRRYPGCIWYWNARELGGSFGHDASRMDDWNNRIGYGCAGGSASCYACCLANIDKLTWYEPKPHNWPPPDRGLGGGSGWSPPSRSCCPEHDLPGAPIPPGHVKVGPGGGVIWG
ncbi:MAG: hypothetical protein HND43_07225 [Armatimonadetes bacterium]|nr:hypothetical protein [Armatimonadota bacterium]